MHGLFDAAFSSFACFPSPHYLNVYVHRYSITKRAFMMMGLYMWFNPDALDVLFEHAGDFLLTHRSGRVGPRVELKAGP